MDSIKKKMQSLAKETANAQARAEKWEKEMEDTNRTADHFEEQVRVLQKKIQAAESQFDVCTEDLFNQTIKMEEMEKKAGNAEGQVGDLARRLLLLEENAVKSEERLAGAVTNLATASLTADRSIKDQHELSQVCTVLYCTVLYCTYCSVLYCTVLSQVCAKKAENIDQLEQQLKDAQYNLTESENKYETMARKLKTMESEQERSVGLEQRDILFIPLLQGDSESRGCGVQVC